MKIKKIFICNKKKWLKDNELKNNIYFYAVRLYMKHVMYGGRLDEKLVFP